MQRRIPRFARLTILAALLAFLLPIAAPTTPADAQVRIPVEARFDEADVRAVLDKGTQLERNRRWGEALTHYEDALRSYPGRVDIEHRLSLARIHFDLSRRYADRSFTAALKATSERAALDQYSEVLLKIQSHYVTTPDWRELLRRGATHLDVALTEETFVKHHLPGAKPEQIESLRGELYRRLDWRHVESRYEVVNAAASIASLASQRVGLSPAAVILEFTCGAAGSLDDYSAFLTSAQLEDVFSQIEGNFVGLGIELKAEDGALKIVNTIPGSPADQAGIRPGDLIVAVDGRSTRDLTTDKAADVLKGERGTTVEVTVLGPDGKTRQLRVRRERIEVPSIEDAKILDAKNGVAYMRLTSFQKTTSRDMDAALWRLHREGMRHLIVDLRGNPGGLLTAAVETADKFVMNGKIVSTRGRNPHEDFDYKAREVGTWRVPLVVLIDGDSASASEIFAGAIRDHRRGQVVGQQSYGKGSVQGIFPLAHSKSGLRLTTAKFYSPSGRPISKQGVTPDIIVRMAAKPVVGEGKALAVSHGDKDDPVLAAAVRACMPQR